MTTNHDEVKPGVVYERDWRGRLVERHVLAPGEMPDIWVCRRVVDYPHQQPPAGAATDVCQRCGAVIAYNPARRVVAPRVCMQCAGIEPLPIGGDR